MVVLSGKTVENLHFLEKYNIITIVLNIDAPLAQLVEHLTLNQGVQGSSP